ncbi:MAG: helix-turn-helix transcriptional regulator [Acidobacteriota bacterium]
MKKNREEKKERLKRPASAKGAGGPVYHISAVAEMYGLHPQTLRMYEREGLLMPSRSEGNTRLYSAEDLKRLEIILNLIRDLGVNLAGVEVILNMRDKIERIESEVGEFLGYIQREFFQGKEEEFEARKRALMSVRPSGVVKVKNRDE